MPLFLLSRNRSAPGGGGGGAGFSSNTSKQYSRKANNYNNTSNTRYLLDDNSTIDNRTIYTSGANKSCAGSTSSPTSRMNRKTTTTTRKKSHRPVALIGGGRNNHPGNNCNSNNNNNNSDTSCDASYVSFHSNCGVVVSNNNKNNTSSSSSSNSSGNRNKALRTNRQKQKQSQPNKAPCPLDTEDLELDVRLMAYKASRNSRSSSTNATNSPTTTTSPTSSSSRRKHNNKSSSSSHQHQQQHQHHRGEDDEEKEGDGSHHPAASWAAAPNKRTFLRGGPSHPQQQQQQQPYLQVQHRTRSDVTEQISNRQLDKLQHQQESWKFQAAAVQKKVRSSSDLKNNNEEEENENERPEIMNIQSRVPTASSTEDEDEGRDEEEGEEVTIVALQQQDRSFLSPIRLVDIDETVTGGDNRNGSSSTAEEEEIDNDDDSDDNNNDSDDDNNSSTTSFSLDLDVVSRINANDKQLMDKRSTSPGALRLTAEGLRSHEETVLFSGEDENRPTDVDSGKFTNTNAGGGCGGTSSVEQWKLRRDEERWRRKILKEREEEKLANEILASSSPGNNTIGVNDISIQLEHGVSNINNNNNNKSSHHQGRMGSPIRKKLSIPSLGGGGGGFSNLLTTIRSPKEDVTEVSLAPLAHMEQFNCLPAVAEEGSGSGGGGGSGSERKGILGINNWFRTKRRSSSVKAKAQAMLEKERISAMEAQRFRYEEEKLHSIEEEHDLERVERMRRAHLDKERAKEAAASIPNVYLSNLSNGNLPESAAAAGNNNRTGGGGPSCSEGNSSCYCPTDDDYYPSDGDDDEGKISYAIPPIFRDLTQRLSDPCLMTTITTTPIDTIPEQISAVSSSASSVLPPCVVCHTNERSHIAMPCMHFSFCGTCVAKLQSNAPKNTICCPVCMKPNVTFGSVAL